MSEKITREELYPHNEYERKTGSKENIKTHMEEKAEISEVAKTANTLLENNVSRDKAVEIGRHMASLIYHGGMTPSEAKGHSVRKLLRSGRTLEEVSDMINLSRGGLSALTRKASSTVSKSKRLYFMNFFSKQMNLVFDFHIATEPPADYETRYMLFEVVDRREEAKTVGQGPNPRRIPPEPKYGLVMQWYTNDILLNPSKPPEERTWGAFDDQQIVWFMNDNEVVEYLYEDEYFWSKARAEVWKEQLETFGFVVDSPPAERINPDTEME